MKRLLLTILVFSSLVMADTTFFSNPQNTFIMSSINNSSINTPTSSGGYEVFAAQNNTDPIPTDPVDPLATTSFTSTQYMESIGFIGVIIAVGYVLYKKYQNSKKIKNRWSK